MGIKGLKPFLAKMGFRPQKFSLGDFRGCAVAIDGYGYVHTIYAAFLRGEAQRIDALLEEPNVARLRGAMYDALVKFVLVWLRRGVTPVFIFDGAPPPEKETTQAKRGAEKLKQRQKLEYLKSRVLEATPADLEEARRLTAAASLPHGEITAIINFLSKLGVPCLRAKSEGEALCSMGARDGKFAAVFSKDTDNLAYGCPLLLTEIVVHNGEHFAVGYDLERVLQALGVAFPLFVDLCIMAGCDYNANIRGLGPVKSFALLKARGSIDNLPDVDVACLNHERCRSIFSYVPFGELLAPEQPGAARDERDKNAKEMAISARRFGDTGWEALDSVGLAEYHHSDFERAVAACVTPMLLLPRHPAA